MTATITPIAPATDVDSAWEAYRRHRALEADRPALDDDEAHTAEARRLHARFMELFDQRPADAVVIPFRGRL